MMRRILSVVVLFLVCSNVHATRDCIVDIESNAAVDLTDNLTVNSRSPYFIFAPEQRNVNPQYLPYDPQGVPAKQSITVRFQYQESWKERAVKYAGIGAIVSAALLSVVSPYYDESSASERFGYNFIINFIPIVAAEAIGFNDKIICCRKQ